MPHKLISYLTEIKEYIAQYRPKEPVFIFLENYDKNRNTIDLERDVKSIFKPNEYVSFQYFTDPANTVLKDMAGKVVFLTQNYDMPDNSPLNKATYSGLFNTFDQSNLSGVRRRKWNIDKDSYQLSIVSSDPITKFNQEDIQNALDKKINVIKVDDIQEKDLRFLKTPSIYEQIQSKEAIFLPSAIIAGAIISTTLPKESRAKFVADFVAGIVLPFNGRVVYNLTRNSIESFDTKVETKKNILNIIKASVASILKDGTSQALFSSGFGIEGGVLVNLGLNAFFDKSNNESSFLSRLENSFYKAIDASAFGLTNFQKDVKKMEEGINRCIENENSMIV